MKQKNKQINYFYIAGSFLAALFFIFLAFIIPFQALADTPQDGSCSSNSDCASALFCDPNSGNTCQPVVSGSPCQSFSDCYTAKTGLTCTSGKCIVPTTGANNPTQYPIGQPSGGGSCGTTDPNVIMQIQGIVGVTQVGICGRQTIAAIQSWQQKSGLTDDGIIGPQTASAMGLSSTLGTPTSSGSTGSTGSGSSAGTAVTGSPGPCPTGLSMDSSSGLCLPPSQFNSGIAASTSLTALIFSVIKLLLLFSGVVAVFILVIGGYLYMSSGGNEEQAEKGKKTVTNFALGLFLIIMAYAIVTIIGNTLTDNNFVAGSSGGSSITNNGITTGPNPP